MKPSTVQAIEKLVPSDGLTFGLVIESEIEGAAVGYRAGFVDGRNAAIAAIQKAINIIEEIPCDINMSKHVLQASDALAELLPTKDAS